MITKIIEATNNRLNWGKFMVCRYDGEEWSRKVKVDGHPYPNDLLFRSIGTDPRCVWVLDLQTGEGALFKPGGNPTADLDKHRVWVCPMFEPFLNWLYGQNLNDLSKLPDAIDIPDAEFRLHGYRRPGSNE